MDCDVWTRAIMKNVLTVCQLLGGEESMAFFALP